MAVYAEDMHHRARPAVMTNRMPLPCRCGGRRGRNIISAIGGRAGWPGGVSALLVGHHGSAAGGRGPGAPCAGVQNGVKMSLFGLNVAVIYFLA